MSEKRRGLGRGLGALIPSEPAPTQKLPVTMGGEENSAVNKISENKTAADSVSNGTPKPSKKATRGVPAADRSQGSLKTPTRGTPRSPSKSDNTLPSDHKVPSAEAAPLDKGSQADVSRETTSRKSTNSRATRGTASRRDMGQALRNTTSVRRPVDMFFLPSPDSQSNGDTTADGEAPANDSEIANAGAAGVDAPAGNHKAAAPPKMSSESGLDSVVPDVSRETSGDSQTHTAAADKKRKRGPSKGDPDASTPATVRTERSVEKGERQTSLDFMSSEPGGMVQDDLTAVPGARFANLRVADIHPNRKQPRQVFDEDELEELAFSVKELGVLQPVVVRPSREVEDKYELVMGERRWRAVQRADLEFVPAIVRETSDDDLLRDALLENLHRSQLNPLEEAAAYQQLLEEFGATQEELSRRIGRSRPQISNTLRLLRLPALVQRRVAAGVLSSGHARALLGLADPAEMERLAQRIVAEGLSVRATEEAVTLSGATRRQSPKNSATKHRHEDRLNYIADAFSDRLDTSVKIQLGARKGKMTIEFATVEDLNRIIDVLDPKITGQS